MRHALTALLVTLLAAQPVFASDAGQTHGQKTLLRTSRAAHCSTPSGKAHKECSQQASAQTQPMMRTQRY